MIRIITDTASDITLRQAQEMDVTLLSMPVSFGQSPYDQLLDEDFTQFYHRLETEPVLPVTSLSSPGEYLALFEEAKERGDSVIAIPISSRLSGSYQSACAARDMTDYDDIHVVDARQALIGQRLMVEYAVRLRQEGVHAGEIARLVAEASGRVRLYGVLDTLKYLIKGGRISKSAGVVGSALGIKPLVCLQDGAVGTAGKARGRDGAAALLLQHIRDDMNFDPSFPFCFGYTQNREPVDAFAKLAEQEFGLQNCPVYPVGGVIGTHVGPNAVVAVWVVK